MDGFVMAPYIKNRFIRGTVRAGAFCFSHAAIVATAFSAAAFYQLQFKDAFQSMTAGSKPGIGLCAFVQKKPTCAVITRTVFRVLDHKAGDPRACKQTSRLGKFVTQPTRAENWDKTALKACIIRDGHLRKDGLAHYKALACRYLLEQQTRVDHSCRFGPQ